MTFKGAKTLPRRWEDSTEGDLTLAPSGQGTMCVSATDNLYALLPGKTTNQNLRHRRSGHGLV